MKYILSYLKPYKKRMLIGFCYKTTGTVAELILPFFLTYILDSVIVTLQIKRVILFGIIMVLFSVIACLGNIIANRKASRISTQFSQALRKELFSKTLYLSAKDTDAFTIPSLESRITTDTYNVHNFINMMQRIGVRAPMLLLGGTAVTLIMDPVLSLVMIATLPLIFVTVYSVSRKGVPLYVNVQKSTDNMVRVVREDAQGIRVIKALSKNEYENRRYDRVNLELSKQERHAGVIMSSVNPIMTLLMNLGIAGVVAVAAFQVSRGKSSAATVIAFMQYFTLISMAMLSLSRMFVMYTKCAASARRIAEIITNPDSFYINEKQKNTTQNAHIVFENVSFSYLKKKNNLQNIDLCINRGSSLGIIGATGSGKSTFLKLLLRFYNADSGKILINGQNINTYTRQELTSMFGAALQNDFIYAGTIEENIKFGRDISHEDVVRAAEIAQAHGFITAFEGGYGRMLSAKGTNISGGQRQRILIARAIAAKPEILVLDDSSSALDYKTDSALRHALRENMSSSTVITIAQRVSSVKDCENILVLDNGRAIGYGSHEQLLKSCAQYKEISDSQMGGVLVD